MNLSSRPRGVVAVAGALTMLALAGCSGGSGSGDGVEIDFLVDNSADTVAAAEALVEAFEADHPNISVTLETRPGGAEGDNIVKTRLSTGEMADVFIYNTGSLFQALNPDSTLVEMSDQPWASELDEEFVNTVSTENGTYGNAWGATFGGGILYNRAVYEDLGLEVPQSWDEFMANNETIAAESDVAPVIQTYGATFTSQLWVLADFGNVLADDPEWADEYTANNRAYAEEPAVAGFEHLQEVQEGGYFNEDFASATDADGARMLAEGAGAHYPMLSNLVAQIQQIAPDAVQDIGYFAMPAEDAASTTATIWQATGVYVPQTTEDAEREAAMSLVEFITSDAGCEIQNEHLTAAGPYPGTCELPEDAPPILTDLQTYVDEGRSAPALEFLSPIKGPNLEHILVEVGSGIRPAGDAAARYDQDVVNQAQQLGIEGW
ncbi:ABC transporter substrate-binding protein [Georgenia alba]|uniref:ABC transporter substrate-binding protein n=1 Tax=Georgenia alba TaxID=2233858 RepID=A0ABW2Q1W3_9MICO